jgi:hypothetical protein
MKRKRAGLPVNRRGKPEGAEGTGQKPKSPLEYVRDNGEPFPAQAWKVYYWNNGPHGEERYITRLILATSVGEALEKARLVFPNRIKAIIHEDIYR